MQSTLIISFFKNINNFVIQKFHFIIEIYHQYPHKTFFYLTLIFIFTFLLKIKINNTSYFFALLTSPATIMHELTHLVVSIFTLGKPNKISLIPQKTNDGIIFGYVQNTNIKFYNAIFIGLAPFTLLIFSVFFIFQYLIPETNIYKSILYFYISLILIEGGIPSTQDFKIAFLSWPLFLFGLIAFFLIKF